MHCDPTAIKGVQLFCCVKTGEEKSISCTVRGAPVTLAVKVFVADWFTKTFPKSKDVGVNDTTGTVPIPLRLTVCGLLGPLSEIVIVPDRRPTAVGAKVTVIVQLLPDPSDAPQLFVCVKSPLAETPVIASAVFI
jgi:hypothetical protein